MQQVDSMQHTLEGVEDLCMPVQQFDLIMYGDTLIEAWRGTILGEPNPRVQGCSEIFHSHFGHKYSSLAFGIAGEAEGPQLKHSRSCRTPKHCMSLAWAIPAQHYQHCVQGCEKNKC